MEYGSHHSVRLLQKQFKDAQNIGIFTHVNPDADAVCSAIALKRMIKKFFVQKDINNEDIKKNIVIFAQNLDSDEKLLPMVVNEDINVKRLSHYDLVIAVDCPNTKRLGKYEEVFVSCKNSVNIDHHDTNEKYALNNIHLKVSSTCEVLYHLAKYIKLELPSPALRHLYCGIITDTANLKEGNVKPGTLKVIAELMKKNIQVEALREYFFKSNTIGKTQLLQKALNSIHFFVNDKIAMMQLSKTDCHDVGAETGDAEGLVNYANDIKGIQVAAMILEKEDGLYHISLRSKMGTDVGEIAKSLGGGGSENVAAYQVKINYEHLDNEQDKERFKTNELKKVKFKLVKACRPFLSGIEEELDDCMFVDDDEDNLNK